MWIIRTKSNPNNKNSVGKEKFIFSKKNPNSLIEIDKGVKKTINHKNLSILNKNEIPHSNTGGIKRTHSFSIDSA